MRIMDSGEWSQRIDKLWDRRLANVLSAIFAQKLFLLKFNAQQTADFIFGS